MKCPPATQRRTGIDPPEDMVWVPRGPFGILGGRYVSLRKLEREQRAKERAAARKKKQRAEFLARQTKKAARKAKKKVVGGKVKKGWF